MNSLSSKIETLSQWIVKLAYVNILWFLFCLLGGVILGWAPATVSLFTVMRKWIRNEDFPILSTFYKTVRKEFIKANVSGLVILGLAIVFIANILALLQHDTFISNVFLIGNGTMVLVFALFLMFFFPVYVHYVGGAKTMFNKTFLITLARLPYAVLAFVLCVVWGKILMSFPGLFIFFGISIPALMITFNSQQCFLRKESHFKNVKIN